MRSQTGLDDGVELAEQRAGDVAADGGIAAAHLVGLEEGDRARLRRRGSRDERLPSRSARPASSPRSASRSGGTRRRAPARRSPPSGPGRAGPPPARSAPPAAHPDQPEVAHRRADGRPVGVEVVDGEARLEEFERVPRPDDAGADHDGLRCRCASRPGVCGACPIAVLMASAASHGRACPKTALPATKTFAPARAATGAVSGSMPPSTSMSSARPSASTAARTWLTLLITSAMKLWPAETREHGHAQHEVDLIQIRLDGLERRVGVERKSRPQAEAAHLRDELVGVADLDVHRAAVGPRPCEVGEIAPGIGHHQVAVEEQRRVAAQRGHDRRPDRDVGDEVPVHDVDVQPVGRGRDLADLLGQHAEVRRQHGGRDAHVAGSPRVAGVGGRHLPSRIAAAAQLKRAQQRMRRNP